MKKSILLFVFAAITLSTLSGQGTTMLFKAVTPDQVVLPPHTRRGSFPEKFDIYRLDFTAMKSLLSTAPREFSAAARHSNCIVPVPLANGQVENFAVCETAIIDEEAAAMYPEIHTYAGISTVNPYRSVRLSTTLRGFRAMVTHPDYSASFVEPYAWGQTEYYIAFDRLDAMDTNTKWRTEIRSDGNIQFGSSSDDLFVPEPENRGGEIDPVRLKIYRLCVATTGEFAQDHGSTKQEVFNAMAEYVNMVDAAYERDITLRLQLIAASNNVVFLNPVSDPYVGTTAEQLLQQNTNVLNTYCNFNSHDIGHVLGRLFPDEPTLGVGASGVTCLSGKAGGASVGNGTGDYGPRFLHTLGQELGHQLGAGHTYNSCQFNSGRDGTVAFEPGGGSTIMSYAGLCNSDNLQPYADLYFNTGSIHQIKTFYTFGGACGSYLETTNHAPELTLPYTQDKLFYIPISTPFELVGNAGDPDGDALTYCWEETDSGPEVPLGVASGNTAVFRTFVPVNVPNRYFPKLSTVIANGSQPFEILPTYTRDFNFRLTVRDNVPNAGGVTDAEVSFKSYEGAGPFVVTYPNSNSTTWQVGAYEEVGWDVAHTNEVPVNCQKVNILLSTDGGQSYPVVLASNVENDGKQFVLVPNQTGNTMRVRVQAADNIFFDISNANFKIEAPTQNSLSFGLSSDGSSICLPDQFSTQLLSSGLLGYNTPVSVTLDGDLPPGATADFSTGTFAPGTPATFTVDLSQVTVEGLFTFNVHAVSGAYDFLRPVTLLLHRNDFSGFALQTPANGQTNAALVQTLHWEKGLDADSYDVEFSLSPSFNAVLASQTATPLDSFKINFLLQKGTAYYWRVRPINECGRHDWSAPFFFSTYPEDCRVYEANDLPKNISANGTPTVESKISINQGNTISDVNIRQITGYHTFFKDLEAHLIGPDNTDVLLWKDKCGNFNGSFNFALDDDAPNGISCPPNNSGNSYRPTNPLTPFYGINSNGVWTLRIKDNSSTSGGLLSGFKIEFCTDLVVQPPYLVNNIIMPITAGGNKPITPDYLLVEDSDNTHNQLKYTLLTVPQNGVLNLLGFGIMHPGDMFTQADLDAGNVRYFDYGNHSEPEGFHFMVTDGTGGFFGTPEFLVQPLVAVSEPPLTQLDFMLYPNPASDFLQLAFNEPVSSQTQLQLCDLAGRRLAAWTIPAGSAGFQLRLSDRPSGIYLVVVQNDAGSGARKLLVR